MFDEFKSFVLIVKELKVSNELIIELETYIDCIVLDEISNDSIDMESDISSLWFKIQFSDIIVDLETILDEINDKFNDSILGILDS